MSDKIPFDAYDFFAYLASGFVVLFAIDAAFPLGAAVPAGALSRATLGTVGAYLIGHAVAQVAALSLERGIVHKALSAPAEVLLRLKPAGRWGRVFRDYGRPLTVDLARSILAELDKTTGASRDPDIIMHIASRQAMRDQFAGPRLEKFLRLYGFARNGVVATLTAAALFAIAADHPQKRTLALVAVATALVLWFRFLKFYRLYALESLVVFLKPKAGGRPE